MNYTRTLHCTNCHNSANQRRISILGSNKVTFLVDRNINYTNVCAINCQFCSFYRPPGHEETYTQSYQEISQRIVELEEIGGSRILMQGGVNPSLKFDWYLELLEFLQVNHPTIHLDCFSPIEIEGIAEISGLSTLEVLTRLSQAGMHGLPGGAEMLVDSVRKDISPKKGLPENWLRIMKEAQSLGLTTSATNVFGFGETIENRVEHLAKIQIFRTNQSVPLIMVLHHLLLGLCNSKQIHLESEIVVQISILWVQDLLNISDTLQFHVYFWTL